VKHRLKLRPPPREIPLKFRFGDWCLHVHRFKGILWPAHSSSTLTDDALPTVALEPGLDVLFAPSVPVSSRLAVLTFGPDMIRYVEAQYNRYHLALAGDFPDHSSRAVAPSPP
jgi:hypothetical protein